MSKRAGMRVAIAVVSMGLCGVSAGGVSAEEEHGGGAGRPHCTPVYAFLVEDLGGDQCEPEHPRCYLGRIEGFGLRGTSHFFAEGAALAPPQSPGWISYSGVQVYTTAHGTLRTRETGLVNRADTSPVHGASLSLEEVVEGTGALAGATGYLFVSGFNHDGHVESEVTGKICTP